MQTKRQVQQLLASVGQTPNRRFGQHFLVDLNLMGLLVDSAEITRDDVVLEVGCGTGSLTEALAEQAGRVVAVELDRPLAAIVTDRLAGHDHVGIVQADVLASKGALNPLVIEAVEQACGDMPGRLLLVANLPYDVGSVVMANLVRGPVTADAMFVTVQKEVADRMEAVADSRSYGTLSVLLGATGHVERMRVLPPSVFWPPPKVDSAMVRYVRDAEKCRRIEQMTCFAQVVGHFMGHRRKMLRACARSVAAEMGGPQLWADLFARCDIESTLRPGELSPEQYVLLANTYRHLAAGPQRE
jgi:16S rRNA (adenine1518-N6/adenine1519-N6)-dimethyltransferase